MSLIHCSLRSNYTNLLVIQITEYLYLFISNNNFRQLQSFDSNENVDESSRKKRKYWNSSRFGDLNDEDFSTPRRRKKNLMVVCRTVSNLRHKNKLLLQKNKRL